MRYCSAGESCDDFDLAEPTPELINKDPEGMHLTRMAPEPNTQVASDSGYRIMTTPLPWYF